MKNSYCDISTSCEIVNKLKAENEDLKNFHINLVGVKECEIRELLQLKKTLAEIKEIAECCPTPANCKEYCQFYDECVDGGLPLILQKISECEVEE